MVPNVKWMDSQRKQKACEAILQAVGQRKKSIDSLSVGHDQRNIDKVSRRIICAESFGRQGCSC